MNLISILIMQNLISILIIQNPKCYQSLCSENTINKININLLYLL